MTRDAGQTIAIHRRVASGAAIALTVTTALGLAAPHDPAAAAAMEVSVKDGRLTAEIGAVPVADLLRVVARQTGAELRIRGELGNARPQAFSAVPLAEALPRLVQPNGVILEFGRDTGAQGERRLVTIRVVAPGVPGVAPGEGTAGVTTLDPQDPRRGLPPGFWDYARENPPLPNATERIAILTRTARGRGATVTGALAYVLRNDPETTVRQTALGLLAPFPGEDVRLVITEAVADADPQLRMDALRAASGSGRPKPVALIAQAAKGDTDPGVRAAALGLLSRKDGDLARAVLEGARNDADPQVREAADQALRRGG